jgi:SAM-dependent methyltransferase
MSDEPTQCLLCGSQRPRRPRLTFGRFQVLQCSVCGFRYLSPRLPESRMLSTYASPDYFAGDGEIGYTDDAGGYRNQEETLRRTFRRFVRQLAERGLTGGRLLELGCGKGLFLEQAAGWFQEACGLDLNREALEAVWAKGFSAWQGGLEALEAGRRFECILSINVLEHIYEPRAWIERIERHLSSGGWTVHATPRIDGLWFKLMGRRWPSFKIPEHVGFYSPQTLSGLYRRCGAREVRRLRFPHAFPAGLVCSKLGLPLPAALRRLHIWIPGTMVAMAARF